MNKNRELSHLSLSKKCGNANNSSLNSSSNFIANSNFSSISTSPVSHSACPNPVQSAFTIIELLVVIAIIAILAALIFVAYPAIVKSALQATMQSSLSTSYRAIVSFQSMNDRLPTSISDCDSSTSTTAKDAGYSSSAATTLCLKPGNNFTYIYTYDNNSTPQTFTLYAKSTASSNQNLAYKVSSSNSNPIASTNGKTCPNNFILVPGSSTYGTSDFCVMKYEAKQYNTALGTNSTYVQTTNPNSPVSRPSGTPWVNVSQTTAIANSPYTVDNQGTLLSSQGYTNVHLITEAEWMSLAQNVLQQGSNWSSGTVGSGFIYNGHVGNNPATGLDADSSDTNSNYGEATYDNSNVNTNNKRTLTLSNGEVIWDLSGNVHEWTQGQSTGHQPGLSSDTGWAWRQWNASGLLQNGFPTSSMPYSMASGPLVNITSWTTSNGIGGLYSYYGNTALCGFLRGGGWSYGSSAGVLYLHLNTAPGGWSASVGFRVVVVAS